MKPIEEMTFEDLCVHYGTGRAVLLSGEGRNKKYGYRHGCMTNLGDIELSRWQELAEALIARHGEEELQKRLLLQVEKKYPWLHTAEERKQYALELHAARLFSLLEP